MAEVKGNWLSGQISGSPCKYEGIYVRSEKMTDKNIYLLGDTCNSNFIIIKL